MKEETRDCPLSEPQRVCAVFPKADSQPGSSDTLCLLLPAHTASLSQSGPWASFKEREATADQGCRSRAGTSEPLPPSLLPERLCWRQAADSISSFNLQLSLLQAAGGLGQGSGKLPTPGRGRAGSSSGSSPGAPSLTLAMGLWAGQACRRCFACWRSSEKIPTPVWNVGSRQGRPPRSNLERRRSVWGSRSPLLRACTPAPTESPSDQNMMLSGPALQNSL